jgi:hypothetical protein
MMIDNGEITGNALKLLQARQAGKITTNAINIGGRAEAYGVYQVTSKEANNSTSNIKYLESNPLSGIRFPFFDLNFTGAVGDWTSAYIDLRVTDNDSGEIKIPDFYFVVGNLNKNPVYSFAGKKMVEFGSFKSENNFTPTLTRAYFMAYGAQAGIGYNHEGIDATFTVINGNGKYLLNSKASNTNKLNNFALNIGYNARSNDIDFHFGAGYISSTGFSGKGVNLEDNNESDRMVGALALNSGIEIDNLKINAELLMTVRGIKGMNNSSTFHNRDSAGENNSSDKRGYTNFAFGHLPVLMNFNSGSTVKAWSLSSSYNMIPFTGKDLVPYVSYSHVSQNAKNNMYQVEVGTRHNIIDEIWIGSSYNYTNGKSEGTEIGKFHSIMMNASVYF